MFSSFSQCALTFVIAINIELVKGIMVESMDRSFVPLSFVAHAPGDVLAVRMVNNHDLAYLVCSHLSTCMLSTDEVLGNCSNGLVFFAVSLLRPT